MLQDINDEVHAVVRERKYLKTFTCICFHSIFLTIWKFLPLMGVVDTQKAKWESCIFWCARDTHSFFFAYKEIWGLHFWHTWHNYSFIYQAPFDVTSFLIQLKLTIHIDKGIFHISSVVLIGRIKVKRWGVVTRTNVDNSIFDPNFISFD